MPLEHSSSKQALENNMRTLHADIGKSPHVQSRDQAIAIALETQRRAKNKAGGGALSAFEDMLSGVFKNAPNRLPPELSKAMSEVPGGFSKMSGDMMGSMPQMSPSSPLSTAMTNGMSRLAPIPQNSGIAPQPAHNNVIGMSPVATQNRADGGFSMQKGPHLSSTWQNRAESRSMHTGPVLSSVPGRTDHHPTRVPSGSYVLPADIIAGRGQGNTLAGMKSYMQLFKMGPYGTSLPHLGHGAGIPKGPQLQKAHSGGGKGYDGSSVGTPTPVNIAGGELVVPPENLMETVHPDLDTAHRILDQFVINERKNHIKELKGLPPPAKD